MTDFFNLPDGLSMESMRKICESVTKQNQLTNCDRIRAASEDEIIQWYCRHRDCGTCDYGHGVDCTIRAWLKSPVEVEDERSDKG